MPRVQARLLAAVAGRKFSEQLAQKFFRIGKDAQIRHIVPAEFRVIDIDMDQLCRRKIP